MSGQLVADRDPAIAARGHDAPVAAARESVFEIMSTTRAMRRLAPDPVPDELLRSLVQAATWAPTGSNAQGEAYVLVTDRAVMARLAPLWRRVVDDYLAIDLAMRGGELPPDAVRVRDAILYQRDRFAETPALIVVCYDNSPVSRARRSPRVTRAIVRHTGLRRFLRLTLASGRFGARSEAGSVYPGVQNLLLAARAHGLAACMTTWHLLAEGEFKRELGIPSHVGTFAVIPVGWPLGAFGPVRRRPPEAFIRRDGWRQG